MGFIFRIRQIVILLTFVFVGVLLWNSLQLSENGISNAKGDLSSQIQDSSLIKIITERSDSNRANSSHILSSTKFETGKCNIPKLDINGKEVINFFHAPPPLACQKSVQDDEKNWLYVDDDGRIRFIERRKRAVCHASFFERKNDNENAYGKSEMIKDGDLMQKDFAVVNCKNGFKAWRSLLMTVVKNEEAFEKAKSIGNKEKLNVFFLGFDSLSQMTFRRKLPKTVKVLEDILEAVVLNGYNIVGDGTPQAFIPILTAQTEEELPLTRKRFKAANYVDDVYPFIWRNFSDNGYMTAYGEDAFNIGTFTYRLKGFRKQPTDHYTRTFFKEVEKQSDWDCIGSEPLYKMWLQYAKRFMKVYEDVPRFLVMHQSLLSHDDINKVGVEDEDLANFLVDMHETGFFDDSLVIVMADHGHRFAKLRETHQGQLEERLPFFSFTLPKTFRRTERGALMQANLEANKDRLTVPFDIHATLLDILQPPAMEKLVEEQQLTQRSLSLFRPIPEERTCSQAGVEPHWCTCLAWQDAMANREDKQLSTKIAHAVVRAFNQETQPERQLCAELKLKDILSAKKLSTNKDVLAYKNTKDADGFVPDLGGTTKEEFSYYQLKLKTSPGTAIYEVTVLYEHPTETLKMDFAAVSHVNKYGDTPHCIIDNNYYLASYCVCYDRF